MEANSRLSLPPSRVPAFVIDLQHTGIVQRRAIAEGQMYLSRQRNTTDVRLENRLCMGTHSLSYEQDYREITHMRNIRVAVVYYRYTQHTMQANTISEELPTQRSPFKHAA